MAGRIGTTLRRLATGRARSQRAGEAGPGPEPPAVSIRLLGAFAATYPRARFLEIGANDGRRFDPLAGFVADSEWTGVMVEPVPYVFERLRANLAGNERVTAANVAIAERSGTRPFHFVAEELDDSEGVAVGWYDAIGSFDRGHLLKHGDRIPNLERRIRTIDVPCMTVAEICEQHGIANPDLVLVDAEGFDAEIVGSIDLERIRPRLIVYEHHHLDPGTRASCEARLRGAGYGIAEDGLDSWCLDLRIDDGLSRSWSEIAAS